MRLTVTLIFAALLSGCVSYNTDLVNSNGEATKCAGWAFGWATPIEMAMHHDCMVKAEKAGYHEAGTPQPSATPVASSK